MRASLQLAVACFYGSTIHVGTVSFNLQPTLARFSLFALRTRWDRITHFYVARTAVSLYVILANKIVRIIDV